MVEVATGSQWSGSVRAAKAMLSRRLDHDIFALPLNRTVLITHDLHRISYRVPINDFRCPVFTEALEQARTWTAYRAPTGS